MGQFQFENIPNSWAIFNTSFCDCRILNCTLFTKLKLLFDAKVTAGCKSLK